MRRFFATTTVIVLTSIGAYSQGVVAFINSTATRITFNTLFEIPPGDTPGAFLPTGTRFLVGLFYAPDGPDPGNAGMMEGVMGANVNISPLAGRFSGGNRTTPSTTAPGARAWFQVRVWESIFGSTYEEAALAGPRDVGGTFRSAMCGTSTRFNIQTGTAAIPGVITGPDGLQPFAVFPAPACVFVPEPSVMSLAILGGMAGLLLLRARKCVQATRDDS